MDKIEGLESLPVDKKFIVTIGNFDGVHLGHKKLLEKLESEEFYSLVISFRPHPRKVFSADTGFLLNSYSEKKDLLSECNIDFYYELPFTRAFSELSPEEFLSKFLPSKDLIDSIVIGHDFGFGSNKEGNLESFKQYFSDSKASIEIAPVAKDSGIISSSRIRQFLEEGKIEEANSLLGRPFFISGNIIKGEGRGKKIGFPTANLLFDKDRLVPKRGVYATSAMLGDMKYNSVTNIGFNPTFSDKEVLNVETYILDFDRDIYGEEIIVKFHSKLRKEKKFDSVNDLVKQIANDVKHRKGV